MQQQKLHSVRENSVEPMMPIPKILRHVPIDTLDRGLLSMHHTAPAYGGPDNTFGQGRTYCMVAGSNYFGQKAHWNRFAALKLLFWSRETRTNLDRQNLAPPTITEMIMMMEVSPFVHLLSTATRSEYRSNDRGCTPSRILAVSPPSRSSLPALYPSVVQWDCWERQLHKASSIAPIEKRGPRSSNLFDNSSA
jgi:hypothetical protein